MIRDNTDCPYLHDIFDQYCNLFKGYKNCDKCDCEVLKILKENEQFKQKIKKMKRCVNCKYYEPCNRADNDCSQCSIMFCQCQLDKHWCEAHDEGCKYWELAE